MRRGPVEQGLSLAAQGLQRGVAGIGDDQAAGPPVGGVGDPLHQPLLDECRDVPAHGRGVGMDEVGEGALTQRAQAYQRVEQDQGGTVAGVGAQ